MYRGNTYGICVIIRLRGSKHLMTIFEKMLTAEYKDGFIMRKDNKLGLDDAAKKNLSEYILSNQCDIDIRRLMSGDYFFKPPIQHMTRKVHSSRRRKVYSFRGNEKYLLQYIAYVLMDLDSAHADSLCSFRRDNRSRMFFRNIERIDRHRELYVMKTDIHSYGESIDQDICLKSAASYFKEDPSFLRFLQQLMMRNEYYRDGKLVSKRVSIIDGLPIGNFLTNIYLSELDRILEPKAVSYMRYSDDIAFFTDSYEKAMWALSRVKELSAGLKLTINEEKTRISPPGEDVDLLGIKIYDGGLDIADNSVRKLLSRMKRYRDKLLRMQRYKKITPKESLERMIRYYDWSFFGYEVDNHEFNWVVHAFPIITRTDGLERIDAYVQDCIRVAGSGKLGNSKYRIRYADMVNAGYRNLVSAYYHGYSMKQKPDGGNSA